MKKIFVFNLLLMPCIVFAQEIKLSSGIGYSILKTHNMKKNALVTSTSIGGEFILKEFWYLNTMIGIQTARFEYSPGLDTSIYVSKYFLHLPVSIKNYYPVSKKISLFADLGASFGYEFSTKNEISTTNTYNKISNHKSGLNIGAIINIGLKTQITTKTFVDISLNSQVDMLSFYKSDTDKTKNNIKMLSLTLYRKLK